MNVTFSSIVHELFFMTIEKIPNYPYIGIGYITYLYLHFNIKSFLKMPLFWLSFVT